VSQTIMRSCSVVLGNVADNVWLGYEALVLDLIRIRPWNLCFVLGADVSLAEYEGNVLELVSFSLRNEKIRSAIIRPQSRVFNENAGKNGRDKPPPRKPRHTQGRAKVSSRKYIKNLSLQM